MSKVQESIRINYHIEAVMQAIRSVALRTASPMNESGSIFTIKLKSKLSLMNSGIPAMVTLELAESKKLENATIIKFTSSNIGIGPLQVRECKRKLDRVKELILEDLETMAKQSAEQEDAKAQSKASSDAEGEAKPPDTVAKTEKVLISENKKRRTKPLKNNHYHVGS
jgi:hypothetical protein